MLLHLRTWTVCLSVSEMYNKRGNRTTKAQREYTHRKNWRNQTNHSNLTIQHLKQAHLRCDQNTNNTIINNWTMESSESYLWERNPLSVCSPFAVERISTDTHIRQQVDEIMECDTSREHTQKPTVGNRTSCVCVCIAGQGQCCSSYLKWVFVIKGPLDGGVVHWYKFFLV